MEDSQKAAGAGTIPTEDMAAGPSLGMPDKEDHRLHARYSCDGRAEVFMPHGGLLFHGRIVDVSVAGCFIEAPTINLERGTHVEVYFETRQLRFRVAGAIAVLHRRCGVGISFLSLSFRVAHQIQVLVDELAEASQANSK